MATRTAKLRIELDGEKQYKQALSELNKGNQVLASEMRKLSAEYAGNEKSVEALTKKGDILQRQLLQQKDKVQTLRESLKNAANQYGEADKRTQEWKIKLNDAEAAQFKLEHAIDENNKALKGQGTEMVSLGDAVGELAGKLGIQLPDGALKALNSMQGMSAGSVAALGAVAAGVAVVIKAVKELNNITLEAAANADDLMTKSMTSGVSTTRLQQFRYAAPFIDVDESTLTSSLTKITRSLSTARDQQVKYNESMADAARSGKDFSGELGAQAAAFERLGVSVTDANGELRDNEEVFFEVLEALSGIANETERDSLAMELLGKSAQDLNPLLLQLDEAQRLYNEALENGYVLSEEQLAILGEVDDAQQQLTKTIEAQKNQIAVQWAPATKAAFEDLTKLVSTAGKALVDSGLVSNFAALVESTLGLVEAGADLVGSLPSWINPIQRVSDTMRGLAIVMATVADAATIVAGLAPWNWGSGMIKQGLGMGETESNIQRIINHNRDTSGPIYNGHNASGNVNWRGGLTMLNEAGPEMVFLPSGSRILNAQDTRNMGGDTFNITISAASVREFNDIVELAKSARVRRRM